MNGKINVAADQLGFKKLDKIRFKIVQCIGQLACCFKKTGINLKKINASFLSDPFVSALASGVTPFDIDNAFDEMYKITKWSVDNKTNIKTIGVCGYEYVNAGASSVQ